MEEETDTEIGKGTNELDLDRTLVPGMLALAPSVASQPVMKAAALKAALWMPILPDFLKPSPGFTDSTEQIGKLYLSNKTCFL